MKFRKLCFYDSLLISCLKIINKDENVHRYAVRGEKDRERERKRERDSVREREIEKKKNIK